MVYRAGLIGCGGVSRDQEVRLELASEPEGIRVTIIDPGTPFDPRQPLFRDRKIDATRQQYIVAKRNQASSELHLRESVVQTVATVKQAYWTFKATTSNVGVQQRSLELAEELARDDVVAEFGFAVRARQGVQIDEVPTVRTPGLRAHGLTVVRAVRGRTMPRVMSPAPGRGAAAGRLRHAGRRAHPCCS